MWIAVKKFAPTDLLYERRNGSFILQITGRPSFSLHKAAESIGGLSRHLDVSMAVKA